MSHYRDDRNTLAPAKRMKSFESLHLVKGVPNVHSVGSSAKTFSALSESEKKSNYTKVTYDLFHTSNAFPQQFEKIRHTIDEKRNKAADEILLDIGPFPIKKQVQFKEPELLHEMKEVPQPSGKRVKKDYDVDDHLVELQELVERYQSRINITDPRSSEGLDMAFARRRLELDGPNSLKPPKQLPWFVKFALQFTNFFMVLLEGAGILCFVAYSLDSATKINLYLGIILFAIVFLNCLVAYIQDHQSSNIMNSFKSLLPQACKVVRNGAETRIPVEDVVVGDVVIVNGGDKVPADIRILHANNFKVDNSSLTGESEPQSCTTRCTDNNPLETHNLAFYGTLAMDGSAYGLVIKTGPNTLIGRIADMASESKAAETTLQREIKRFVRFISCMGMAMGAIFFGIGFATKTKIIANLINVLGIIVANVPEGLPSTVTACLTVTARRLAKRNVYVKQMESVETLGSITTIASDKTGTLTQNRMTVSHMWYDEEIVKAYDAGTIGRRKFETNEITCKQLLRIAAVSNRAQFDRLSPDNVDKPIDQRLILGDASESALVRMCEKLEPIEETRARYPKVFEIPFNSTNKWQLSIHRQEYPGSSEDFPGKSKSQRILMLKGAPEIVFEKCSHILIRGEEVPIEERWRSSFQQAYEALGGMGERVLGFAELYLDEENYGAHYDSKYDAEEKNFPMTGLVFVGLASLLDPPRETVPFAVNKCKRAGIKVMMVTGDHPITAKAIAKKVGIITGDTIEDIAQRENKDLMEIDESRAEAVVIHGMQIPDLSEDDWDRILSKTQIVFARTSPQQKSIIVEQCQKRGEVVAVTGDGVNDSPALKKANIGLAMGIVGSDVAKETADVILLDDNFSSIVAGIEEGRIIFDNLKKSICYTLAHLLPEIFPFLINAIAQLPLAITSVIILCIDLGTEMAPAISLAYEKGEADVMSRRPRNVEKDHLVTAPLLFSSYLQIGIIEVFACFATFFFVMAGEGYNPTDLFDTKQFFTDSSPDYIVNGRVYDAKHQVHALAAAQTGYFAALVVCQIFNLLACKTRAVSVFKHGFRNKMVNFAVVIALFLCVLLVYVPGMDVVFGTRPFSPIYWVVPIPFGLLILFWSEIRKYLGRAHPDSTFARLFLW